MTNGTWNWDPNSFLDDFPIEDTPGVKLLLSSAGVLIAGRGESINKVLNSDQHSLGECINTLFPETTGNSGLQEAHAKAMEGDLQSCRLRVGGRDIAWELTSVNTKRGREVLALAIALTDIQPQKMDPTTGIPTRRVVIAQAEETFNRNPNAQWAVLRLKIVGMRRINQALGQDMGDHALYQAVGRIARSLAEGECVGRVGGNEFILIIHYISDDHTVERMQAMDRLFDDPLKVGVLHFMLRLNAGIARSPEDGSTVRDLERRATIALERTRRSGSNCSFFSLTLEDHVLAYSWVPAEAQRALRECEFQLYYQPVVDTRTGETVSMEALIRWQHPWRKLILPGHFIPVIEEMQLIVSLDLWVLERASHEAMSMGKPVAVNITANTIAAPDFLEKLDQVLIRSGLPPSWLTLELTERVFSSPELMLEPLKAVHERGVQIAADDFGVGYSSLSYLWQYPLDKLKLDGSFIRAAALDLRAKNLVTGLVPLTSTLGITLIAECVETKDERIWLHEAGVFLQQGYYFARPAPFS
ncbi:bifunctional diguanylate cyclase/phosphodiesterase [Marinobacter sp.]|uniref:putative bifunctional diguanylate cyclase/phosphodiesterase n=1 Tax=Marinobacter sp. TaxID=50741 RepID=UPI001B71745C|nr:GGDEF domain-containing phosphodiesterase [Marinobacter sp.]MBQ0832115.1 EAL domain-containing protein [Marinobacter sp.]